MININNLTFKYDETDIIKDLNITINKNEKISIIGPSGCGKTTLLFLLAAILKPNEGSILINEQPLVNVRKETGMIFQSGGLFPWKTVYENLVLGLTDKLLLKKEKEEKINQVLNDLGILPFKDKYIKELSGGQRQRVAIGRVLVMNSDLLLLDEPSSALDAMTKDKFQNTLLKLFNQYPLTSVIVTHDIEEAVFLGERIIVMKDGKIDTIISNPLYGNQAAKKSIQFYELCIEVRKVLE